MGDLTKNFSVDEFRCPCCGRADMDLDFIAKLQELRDFIGKALFVSKGGGFRCPDYNAFIGGAEFSQHMKGLAADVGIGSGAHRYEIVSAATRLGFTGIGVAKTFVHVDTRSSAPVMWTY